MSSFFIRIPGPRLAARVRPRAARHRLPDLLPGAARRIPVRLQRAGRGR